jgi:ATP-dependent Clp protease protease subunit
LSGHVGFPNHRGQEIRSAAVIDVLGRNSDATEIELSIDSVGGNEREGFQIYEALRAHRAHVTATAGDVCMSAASLIFMAGDRREAYPWTKFLIHRGEVDRGQLEQHARATGHRWTSDQYAALATAMAKSDGRLLDVYVQRTRGDRRWIEREMKTESPMTLLLAEQHGFIHGLVGGVSTWDALDYSDDRRRQAARSRAR